MANKLDRTKPFGTIHGDGVAVHFEQNGVMFGLNGEAGEFKEASPETVASGGAPASSAAVDDAYARGMKDAMATIDAKVAAAVAASRLPANKTPANEGAKT